MNDCLTGGELRGQLRHMIELSVFIVVNCSEGREMIDEHVIEWEDLFRVSYSGIGLLTCISRLQVIIHNNFEFQPGNFSKSAFHYIIISPPLEGTEELNMSLAWLRIFGVALIE